MPKSKRKKRSNGKTGYFGVTNSSDRGKYRAVILINGKSKNLGSYDTAKQAAKAYDKEAIELRRPFSKLNYPKKAPVGYTPIQQPLTSRNTIGYRGVSKIRKNFQARFETGGKKINLGTYETAIEAEPLPTIVLFSKPTSPQLY